MLPVQLRELHSSCCTLSQASALLERFLSSDACSDSFVKDYVANVAQALHDSISRRGGLEHCRLPAGVYVRQTAPYFPQRELHTLGKTCLPCSLGPSDKKQVSSTAQDVGQDASDMDAGSASPGAKGASSLRNAKRHETLSPSSEASAYANYNRKKRAKENHATETFDHGVHDQKVCDKRKRTAEPQTQTENAVTEYTAPASQSLIDIKRRKKKKQRMLTKDMESADNRDSPVS